MKRGFTLAEILLVVTLIAILAVFALLSFQRQTIRGYDSKRKTDVSIFKVLFEDYYNDHTCYPTKELWDAYDCATKTHGDFLKPYLNGKDLPCDPQTNQRYLYIAIPEGTANACSGYKLFAALDDASDPDIRNSGCDPDPNKGCGYEPYTFNYGISVGGHVTNPTFDFAAPIATPTSTPPAAPGIWVCKKAGDNCQDVGIDCKVQVEAAGCSTYEDGTLCSGLCGNGSNVCLEANGGACN